ncbi:hypothetical protein JQM64_02115 [Fournierella massiliensis]|nr:DUF6311 domain-containing protein [Fournierella massiliensis]MCF2556330.1 hypothetical protein [Fournierella massiliensis]
MRSKPFTTPWPAGRLFAAGCLLGALAFLILYGFSPLDVTWDGWLRGGYVEKDCLQHYAGWLFYRQSDLGFPFCVAQNINWPQGLSLSYTDSIPLFAFLFRLAEPLLPATFQYFGWFTLLCFVLQGGFAALLLSLFSASPLFVLGGSIPFIFSPILVERAFRHASLAAHFLILWALYEYIRGVRQGRPFRWSLLACNALSVIIHPYFTAMTMALSGALVLDCALKNRRLARPCLSFLGYGAACALMALSFGLATGSSSGGSEVEYGYFSMNLNALWNPISRWDTHWSRLLPVQNQTGGNYDGFNYLGLGFLAGWVLLALFVAVRRRALPKKLPGLVLRHAGLLAMCLCCTAFAVSHVVTANGATLFRLGLPQALVRLCTVFRSSGRMFWPVYYLLFLGCLLLLLRCFSARGSAVLVLVLAAVQLWDISPALAERGNEMRQYETEYLNPLTSDFWQEAAERYNHILSLDGLQEEPLFLALYAADNGMTTNDPFAARYDEAALEEQRAALHEEILNGQLRQDSLYLIQDEGLFWELAEAAGDQAFCARLEGGWFVLAPGMEYEGQDTQVYGEDYPLHISDYSDDNWLHGVLLWDHKTVAFHDCDFTRRKLTGASALVCEGQEYPILEISDKDEGWLMVTLDIEDASLLAGKDLESIIS